MRHTYQIYNFFLTFPNKKGVIYQQSYQHDTLSLLRYHSFQGYCVTITSTGPTAPLCCYVCNTYTPVLQGYATCQNVLKKSYQQVINKVFNNALRVSL